MKSLSMISVAALVLLSACASETATSEPTAADAFIGKRLVTESGSVLILNADGTIGGSFRDQGEMVGEYTADATEICSVFSAPEVLAGREYCSTPVLDGDTVIFNRRDGSQSPPYRIEG